MATSADPDAVISALGLGSCVGVVMADTGARVAGMAHVMLPESMGSRPGGPGKFADTAVPALLAELILLGAVRERVRVTLAGGAQMFAGAAGAELMRVGERNAEAVRAALRAMGMRPRATDLGGSAGRTMLVHVGTGEVTVRTVGGGLTRL